MDLGGWIRSVSWTFGCELDASVFCTLEVPHISLPPPRRPGSSPPTRDMMALHTWKRADVRPPWFLIRAATLNGLLARTWRFNSFLHAAFFAGVQPTLELHVLRSIAHFFLHLVKDLLCTPLKNWLDCGFALAAAVAAALDAFRRVDISFCGLSFGQGLCHHDFSPENVVISTDGDAAVVMDFGMAQRMQMSPSGDVVAQQDAEPFGKFR